MSSEERYVHGFRRMTLGELLRRPRVPCHWLVEGLLPAGLTVFAGKSKVGKSIMLLQLVQCIGLGESFLDLPTKQQRVLYLALEDGEDLTQERLTQQEAAYQDAVDFQCGWPTGRQGIAALIEEVESERYGFIVVDTMARVLGLSFDPNKVEHMTAALGPLQQAALQHKIAVMDIDHHSNKIVKGEDDGDPVADIMGSSGKGQVADCVWGLYRNSKSQRASLKAKGRRVAAIEMPVQFKADGTGWEVRSDARQVAREASEAAIIVALQQLGTADAGRVGEALGRHRTGVGKILVRMAEDGKVMRQGSKTEKGAPLVLYSLQ